MSAPVQPRGLVPCDAASFAKDAVSLARFLLGKYLLCPQSEVGFLRIIETEAYPVDDRVYEMFIGNEVITHQRPIPDPAGVLFMQKGFTPPIGYWDNLYVTAEGSGEAGALRPVVLIRSCMPEIADFGLGSSTTNRAAIIAKIEYLLGYSDLTLPNLRENLLINPHTVAMAVMPDFKSPNPSDPTLHTDPGCRLFSGTEPQDPVPMLCGQRVLQDVMQKTRLQIHGSSSMFRFVLDMAQKQYDFAERDALVPCRADQMVPLHPPAQSSARLRQQQVPMRPQQVPMRPQQVPMRPQQVPMRPQQVPVRPQQVPMRPQQVPVRLQQVPMRIPMYPQLVPVYPQVVPVYPQQAPMHSQQVRVHPQQHLQHVLVRPQNVRMHPQQRPQQVPAELPVESEYNFSEDPDFSPPRE